jgi:D-amino-acid dehydrogenase
VERRCVVVVGAGVIGLCCAYFLRRRGLDVIVIERGAIGSGSTSGSSGWLAPAQSAPLPAPGLTTFALRSLGDPDSPLYVHPPALPELATWLIRFRAFCNERAHVRGLRATAELNRRCFPLYDRLAAEGVDVSMRSGGMLFAARSVDAAQRTLEKMRPIASYGYALPADVTIGKELSELEPAISGAVRAGFLVREDRYVDPRQLIGALAAGLARMDVEIKERSEVTGFGVSGTRVHSIRTPKGDVGATDVVLAAGAWTARLAALLGTSIPLQAGKGYSFSVAPTVMPSRPVLIADGMFAATPLGDRLRIAGTMELSGINTRIDPRRVQAILSAATPCFRGWTDGPRDVWTGMRPMTPDGLPILDRARSHKNVFLATGHAMNGLSLGPPSGEALAELVATGEPPAVLSAFRSDRFRPLLLSLN